MRFESGVTRSACVEQVERLGREAVVVRARQHPHPCAPAGAAAPQRRSRAAWRPRRRRRPRAADRPRAAGDRRRRPGRSSRSVARLPEHAGTSRPPSSARYARAPARRRAEPHDALRRRAPPERRAAAAARRASRPRSAPATATHRRARRSLEAAERDLEGRGVRGSRPPRVGVARAPRVHRAAHRHAFVLTAPAPAVLHASSSARA